MQDFKCCISVIYAEIQITNEALLCKSVKYPIFA